MTVIQNVQLLLKIWTSQNHMQYKSIVTGFEMLESVMVHFCRQMSNFTLFLGNLKTLLIKSLLELIKACTFFACTSNGAAFR